MASQLKPAYSHVVLDNCNRVWEKIDHMPSLVRRIIQVQRSMVHEGLVPFVHAAPAAANIPFAFYQSVQRTRPFFQPLRSPIDPAIMSAQEMRKKIPSMEDKKQKTNFLSLSYPFPCNTTDLESAVDWGRCNHYGNEQWFMICNILDSFFDHYNKTFDQKIPNSFKERAMNLVAEHNRLGVGTFLVLGVPANRLSEWMYDSKPYNVPTSRLIEDVLANPESASDSNFATLMISRECLDPTSGLIAVQANHPSQVERFCKRRPFIGAMDQTSVSSFESEEEAKRIRLDGKIRVLMDDFQYWRKHGKERPYVDDFIRSCSDYPGYMI